MARIRERYFDLYNLFKGGICDIPNAEKMSIKISGDTLMFNFGLSKADPKCERSCGVAGSMIDFVWNKKKFIDFSNLKINHIARK